MRKATVPNMTDYESTCREFAWNVPELYNFVEDDFDRWAEDRTKLALISVAPDGIQACKHTFWELSALSKQFANLLLSKGIKRGDRVFLMLPRIPEWYVCMLGMLRAGVIAMPTPTLSTGHDIDYRINKADAVMAITDAAGTEKIDAVRDRVPNLKHRVLVGGQKDGWESFEKLLEKAPRGYDPASFGGKTRSSDPMLVYFTSGTTGNPKMVRHTQAYAIGHTVTARYVHDLRPTDLMWTIADTGWAKTAWGKLFGQWIIGATVLQCAMPGRFEPELPASVLQRFGVTVFCAPPTVYRMMISKLDMKAYDWSSLRHALSAGEPLNPEVIRAFKNATDLHIYDYYGQTETVAIVANYRSVPPREGSMGKPTPGHVIEILDEQGQPLPPDEEGQIAVRVRPLHPPGIFHGYWKDEENTPMAGDWYLTGDKAYKDRDGYFWFVGRADDVIKSSGYRIGPFEVESALQEHEAVMESAVIGVPDEVRGQIVKAFVVLRPGYTGGPALTKALQDHVKKVTAPYKYPREIEFIHELPKTISGKVRRVELRKIERERRAKK